MAMEQILKAIDARDGESFATHLTHNCEFRAPGFTATGPTEAWVWMKAFLDAFPDISHTMVTSFESSGREAAEVTVAGTHTEPLVSAAGTLPPTGRAMSIEAADVLELDGDGRVRSYHVYFDQAGFMAQLGIGG